MLSQKAVKRVAALIAVVLAGSLLYSVLVENFVTEIKVEELDDQGAGQQELQADAEFNKQLNEREKEKMENEKAAINAEIAEMSRKATEAAEAARADAEFNKLLNEREKEKMENEKAAINAEIAEMARKGAEAARKAQ